MTDTNITFTKEDLGKNLYRKKTYYRLVIEQEVIAKDKDEADALFMESGIDHSRITREITEEKGGVETYLVDADYSDSDRTEYVGKVVYQDDEFAQENGDVEICSYTPETETEEVV